jgi:hypothetical protein
MRGRRQGRSVRFGAALLVVATAAAGLALGAPRAARADEGLLEALARTAPRLDREVLRLALVATDCVAARDGRGPATLTVIDYSRPSIEPRLWVFQLAERRLLFEELVAHGKHSGANQARVFSNRPGSLQTSLGLFRTADVYAGRHGVSLRLEGLEAGTNDRALERAIVIHGARYVSTAVAERAGRIGRSWGCPAVRPEVAHDLIETIKEGQLVFAYYPDRRWLERSPFLSCRGTLTLAADASARGRLVR